MSLPVSSKYLPPTAISQVPPSATIKIPIKNASTTTAAGNGVPTSVFPPVFLLPLPPLLFPSQPLPPKPSSQQPPTQLGPLNTAAAAKAGNGVIGAIIRNHMPSSVYPPVVLPPPPPLLSPSQPLPPKPSSQQPPTQLGPLNTASAAKAGNGVIGAIIRNHIPSSVYPPVVLPPPPPLLSPSLPLPPKPSSQQPPTLLGPLNTASAVKNEDEILNLISSIEEELSDKVLEKEKAANKDSSASSSSSSESASKKRKYSNGNEDALKEPVDKHQLITQKLKNLTQSVQNLKKKLKIDQENGPQTALKNDLSEIIKCSYCRKDTTVPKIVGICGHILCEPCIAQIQDPKLPQLLTAVTPPSYNQLIGGRCTVCFEQIIGSGIPVPAFRKIAARLSSNSKEEAEKLDKSKKPYETASRFEMGIQLKVTSEKTFLQTAVFEARKLITIEELINKIFVQFETLASRLLFEEFAKEFLKDGIHVLMNISSKMIILEMPKVNIDDHSHSETANPLYPFEENSGLPTIHSASSSVSSSSLKEHLLLKVSIFGRVTPARALFNGNTLVSEVLPTTSAAASVAISALPKLTIDTESEFLA